MRTAYIRTTYRGYDYKFFFLIQFSLLLFCCPSNNFASQFNSDKIDGNHTVQWIYRKHGTISEGKSFTTNTGKIRYNQSGLAKQAIQLGLIGFECFFEELQVFQSSCFKMNGENSTNKTSKQHGPWTTLNSNKVFHANYLDDLNAATQKHVNVII